MTISSTKRKMPGYKTNLKLSVVIIAKNEEKMIAGALDSVKWADEIVVIDTGSLDKTKEIAIDYGARVVEYTKGSYCDWRNCGLKAAKADWVFYLDADERVSPKLKKEIVELLNGSIVEYSAYAIPRNNIILGREMKHGGWSPDYVKRLFKKEDLVKWRGILHEEPVIKGKMGHLKNHLMHLKNVSLSDMVEKTNVWTDMEAKLLFDSGHPPMHIYRFIRPVAGEIWRRLIIQRGFLDGGEGIILNIFQGYHKFVIYAKLWELQRKSK